MDASPSREGATGVVRWADTFRLMTQPGICRRSIEPKSLPQSADFGLSDLKVALPEVGRPSTGLMRPSVCEESTRSESIVELQLSGLGRPEPPPRLDFVSSPGTELCTEDHGALLTGAVPLTGALAPPAGLACGAIIDASVGIGAASRSHQQSLAIRERLERARQARQLGRGRASCSDQDSTPSSLYRPESATISTEMPQLIDSRVDAAACCHSSLGMPQLIDSRRVAVTAAVHPLAECTKSARSSNGVAVGAAGHPFHGSSSAHVNDSHTGRILSQRASHSQTLHSLDSRSSTHSSRVNTDSSRSSRSSRGIPIGQVGRGVSFMGRDALDSHFSARSSRSSHRLADCAGCMTSPRQSARTISSRTSQSELEELYSLRMSSAYAATTAADAVAAGERIFIALAGGMAAARALADGASEGEASATGASAMQSARLSSVETSSGNNRPSRASLAELEQLGWKVCTLERATHAPLGSYSHVILFLRLLR